ncbi:hypothetical protein HPC49_15505 [Pyxidicoccus fallax]|uniref:Uncharacterized protein n=1 Tax=Pyxidicoccus fallax TaxID=394095 RepID=A0A848LIG3_9BACT|nr:hypothetical protein [Pyxidicoccus fallax]NMO17498.1 hypothetical protein [Pyxidicoccus fallax]NPC79625.1 hypothetical protein [Pyxidicoccus fallax]
MPSARLLMLLLLVLTPARGRAGDVQQDASSQPTDADAPPATTTPAPLVPAEPKSEASSPPADAPVQEQATTSSPEPSALQQQDAAKRRNAHINEGALKGLGVGILTGVGGGALVGFLLSTAGSDGCGSGEGGCVLVTIGATVGLGLIGALVGGLVGPAVGAASAAREWDEAERRTGSPPHDSKSRSSSNLQLSPTVGVSAGGAMGGVIGRF